MNLGPVSSCQVHQVPFLNQDPLCTFDVPPGPRPGRYVGDSDIISVQVCWGCNFGDKWCLRVWWDLGSVSEHHHIKFDLVVVGLVVVF